MGLESPDPEIGPQRLGVGRPSWIGGTLEPQPMLCPKTMQNSSSTEPLGIAPGTPSHSPAPFRCGR